MGKKFATKVTFPVAKSNHPGNRFFLGCLPILAPLAASSWPELRSEVGKSAVEEIHSMILPRFRKSVATAEPYEPVASRRSNTTLFTLAALQFIGFVDFMIIMPLGPQLLADLGVDARRFSWSVSAHTLAAGLAGFLAAPLLDRRSRKQVYIIVATGLLAGTAACGAAGSLPLLIAARCITGAEGSFFGEVAILWDAPRAATIRALADVEVYALRRDGVLQLAHADPDFDRYLKDAALQYSG